MSDSSHDESDLEESTTHSYREPLAHFDTFQGFDDDDDDDERSASPEKDQAEKELEGLVFGDDAGFRARLKEHGNQQHLHDTSGSQASQEDGDRALATVADEDLFFQDTGPSDQTLPTAIAGGGSIDSLKHRKTPAWQDSEDERIMISLASVPRLRKLRQHAGEDVISGKEYTRRLRQQFEVLNPRPKWADWRPQSSKSQRRRRRGSRGFGSSDDGDSSSGNENDMDSERAARPLSQLLQSNESLTQIEGTLPNKRRKIQSDVIAVERTRDLLPKQPSAITCLSIHPTMPIVLSAGKSGTLYLHHLRPHPVPPDPHNPLITSLHVKRAPLTTAAFAPPITDSSNSSATQVQTSEKIYLGAPRPHFHVWDLSTGALRTISRIYGHEDEQRIMETIKPSPCGRFVALKGLNRDGGGVINILDATTLQWAAEVRVDAHRGVAEFAWWRDGEGMTVVGHGGEVSEWSAAEGVIVARWQDEGAVGITTMGIGGEMSGASSSSRIGTDRWIAIGSNIGIVNIYDRLAWVKQGRSAGREELVSPNPSPVKTLDQLRTAISHLEFSPCGQLLAMASRVKSDQLRLVHLPSCTVYRNWPSAGTPLGKVSALAFGEYWLGEGEDAVRSLVLAVGNSSGSLRAWELGG